VEDELNTLRHPILIHVRILIPDVSLRHGGAKASSGETVEIVRVKLDWISESIGAANCLWLQYSDISQLNTNLLHVIVLDPEIVGIVLSYFSFDLFYPLENRVVLHWLRPSSSNTSLC